MLSETYCIPLDTAHQILATFGITSPTKAYERWVKDNGFDIKDFDSVLYESPYIFIIDWRDCLQEVLEDAAKSLGLLGVGLQLEFDEQGETGFVSCEGRRERVSYRPSDDSHLDEVFRSIQRVVPVNIEFRASNYNEGSDTRLYALLPRDEWHELEQLSQDVIAHFFGPLPERQA
jgi:hypothetical protein